MHPYAQTNIQLFNQLRRNGFTNADLDLVCDAYQVAMVLFSGRFQPSGKSFVAHVVGTASILASLRLPVAVVAAGLLHNVYEQGDFGDGRESISRLRRRKIRRILGPETEECVARFPTFSREWPTNQLGRENPDELPSSDRAVLLIVFADRLEHLLDLDVLYYGHGIQRYYLENSKIAAEVADRLGLCQFAAEMREAIRRTEFAELPVVPPKHRNGSFVIAPKSCRMRFSPLLRQGLKDRARKVRKEILKRPKSIYQKLPYEIKAPLASWMGKRKLLGGGLAIKSEEFRGLFPSHAGPARIATGFRFVEGPVWIDEEKKLLFSDIPADRIFGLNADGVVTKFRKPSGNSNGLTRDKEGRLIVCEQGNRRVTRTEKDGSTTVLAELFLGKKLNSPNDVIVRSDGAIYFTDPNYGIRPEEQEQEVQGVYRLSPDGHDISLVAEDFARPNGLAFSPDERKLYIDDSERRHIRVFDVQLDGFLSGGVVFHDMNVNIPGAPDGMKVDAEGRVFCTGARGVWVFDPDGNHLGTIVTPEKPSNCSWGGSDWRTLYITACRSVYAIRVRTPGIPLSTMP
jgi:gluconolactonase